MQVALEQLERSKRAAVPDQYQGPSPQHRPGSVPARGGGLGSAVVLIAVVTMLGGCMEALQSAPGAAVPRPAPLPSATVLAPTGAPAAESTSPTVPGSYAPDPATAAPTIAPTSPVASSPPATEAPPQLPTLALPTPTAATTGDRWRAQQIDRRPFESPRPYWTTGAELWWYDPINQQSVILGRITGNFQGQAEFTLRGQGIPALEVPYQINQSYGLTALSPVLLERIRAAGYTEWIETYVFLTPDVTAR